MVLEVIGWVLVFAGLFFVLTGSIGVLRFKTFFARLHPAGVTDSLGAPLVIFGFMFIDGFTADALKLLLLVIILLITTPTACHALARAARQKDKVQAGLDKNI